MNTETVPVFSSDDSRWQAVVQRDAHADGAFFFAVRTTGVFCRPSCASRAPRRENVEFFATTDAAETAGYRACKRCQPTRLPRDLAIVERACKVLDAHSQQRMTLAQLSDEVHVSPFHLQRLFSRIVGISPRQYQAAQRAGVLRDALQRGRDVTRATHDAGFGSPSRMYDAVPAELGMTPSAYKRQGAGLTVHYTTADTPLGIVIVAATDKGVCKIAFGDDAATLVEQLATDFSQAERLEDAARLEPFVAQIRAYLHGTRERFDLPLDIGATAFQRRVWDALRHIPYGQTRSYSDIAETLGSPRAVRAVANACASNPVALAIPCHRVIGKDGAIAGYRWGASRKETLLHTERTQHATDEIA
ncbi:bifunctional DNA-binding transcriptional regulator/O6-methylguanine-DNA methyltransferase Ada [Caballeronia sp. LZ065]|uniref:bifunctional DNA-binding transcriptional regulator/O6-methylguanine-DNA methyltransferase Ada n=1 Tax=Caballeronia sp. LZ065 TaxID=3038571 RepID=UPI00285C08A1|nr:bifunctional DNA-binding transcriptional regulator/O6-methylguanine-DNA methyltransferase Ada [Caballeronia sp. LZ065]MDR5778032.1 bifunctional DNA-binding transcriptional regulator/O6-methylguanine-DNA methyltransferase Ada [Caballeronia sp. LZ065]